MHHSQRPRHQQSDSLVACSSTAVDLLPFVEMPTQAANQESKDSTTTTCREEAERRQDGMILWSSRVFQLLGLCSGRVVGLGVELHY